MTTALDPRGDLFRLLGVVEATAEMLRDNSAVIGEYGGDLDDLRTIIAAHGRIGEKMQTTVRLIQEKYEAKEPQ